MYNETAMPRLTVPGDFDRSEHGYIVIAPLSEQSKQVVYGIQEQLAQLFPSSSFWFPRGDQLHITFAHVLSPDSDYLTDPEELAKALGPQAIEVLQYIIPNPLRLEVSFNAIEAHESTVIIKGHDDGGYDRLRKAYEESIELPPETRKPPTIIHSTIARFRDELDFDKLKAFVDGLTVSFTEVTTELHYIHEKKIYVQEHDIIARFP